MAVAVAVVPLLSVDVVVGAGYAETVNNKAFTVGIVLLAYCQPLAGQGRVSIDAALHNTDKPYIEATGEATVSVKPDQAVIEIGVVTQSATVVIVAEQNAKETNAVLTDMRRLLGGSAQIKTTIYSVRPNYQTPKPGADVKISGYIATNVVEVTLDDLAQLSKVIDSATQSGANIVQKLQYRLKNPRAVHAQALREAAEQAKASAEAIASGLGVRVIRLLSAEEGTGDGDFGMAKKAPMPPRGTVPTPLEIGMIEVEAAVTVRVEIGQQP